MLLSRLALLLALMGLVAASTQKNWIVCKWDENAKKPFPNQHKFPMDLLVETFEVHGIMSDLAFITAVPAMQSALKHLGFQIVHTEVYDPSSQLYVLEVSPALLSAVQSSFETIPEFKQRMVWNLLDSRIVVLDSIDFLEQYKDLKWVNVVEPVALSKEAILPPPKFENNPLYAHVQKIAFDPTIAFVIEDISSQQLYNYLYDLSEKHYTRQSASSDLVKAQEEIIAIFQSYGFNVSTHTYRSDYAYNVCADLPGKDNPKNYVIVGAHSDSRSTDTNDPTLRAPGAVDNGSGTATMLEFARVLAKTKVTFSNTVRICIWTGEEQGLLGSDAYAKLMKQNNEVVLAYFNADMTGYQLPNTQITLGMKDRSITEWLLELSYEITATYVPELPVALSSSCCSDYISFWNQGYPSIGYFQNAGAASDYPDYHKSTDSIDKINFSQMRLEGQAVLAALMTFAAPYPLVGI